MLPKGVTLPRKPCYRSGVPRGDVKEYLKAIRERYQRAKRKEKNRILDEAVQVTGHHRKALVRALRSRPARGAAKKAGRPSSTGQGR